MNNFVNKNTVTELFYHLTILQQRQELSNRTVARMLGISNSHFSYLHRRLRKLGPSLLVRIITTFPQLRYFSPENLIFSNPVFASDTKRNNLDAKIYELGQAVEDFLVAKQAEGKSNAALSFYRGNHGLILWWFATYQPVKYGKSGRNSSHLKAK